MQPSHSFEPLHSFVRRNVYALLLCLALMPVLPFGEAQASVVLSFFQSQVDGDILYFQSGDGIYAMSVSEDSLAAPGNGAAQLLFPYDERLLTTLAPNGKPLDMNAVLFVWNHQPALLDTENQCVWQYQGDTFVPVVETEEIGLLGGLTVYLACDDAQNTLWFLQEGRLVGCDLTTGRVTRPPISGLTEMAKVEDGLIALQTTGNQQTLIRLPFGADTPDTLATLPTPTDGGIAVDHGTGAICAIVNGMISRLAGDTWQEIIPFSRSPYWQQVFLVGQSYCFVDGSGPHGVSMALGNGDYLYIRGWMPFGQVTDTDYRLANSGLPVLRQTSLAFTPEDVFLDIQSENSRVDLFFLPMSSGLRRLMEKGYLAPMDADAIRRDADEWYDFVLDACTIEGTLYACPVALLPNGWMAAPAEGEGQPAPVDLFNLLSMDAESTAEGVALPAVAHTYGTRWTKMDYATYALRQHLLSVGHGTPTFTDTPFADFLSRLISRDFLETEAADTLFTEAQFPGRWNTGALSFAPTEEKSGTLMPPIPLSADDPAMVHATLYVYVMNPHSRHREEAQAYLTYLAKHRDQEACAFLCRGAVPRLNPFHEEEEQRIQAALADLYAQQQGAAQQDKQATADGIAFQKMLLAKLQATDTRWLIHPDILAVYQRDYAPRIALGLTPYLDQRTADRPGAWHALVAYVRQVLAGRMSLDLCLQQMDQLARQVELEGK